MDNQESHNSVPKNPTNDSKKSFMHSVIDPVFQGSYDFTIKDYIRKKFESLTDDNNVDNSSFEINLDDNEFDGVFQVNSETGKTPTDKAAPQKSHKTKINTSCEPNNTFDKILQEELNKDLYKEKNNRTIEESQNHSFNSQQHTYISINDKNEKTFTSHNQDDGLSSNNSSVDNEQQKTVNTKENATTIDSKIHTSNHSSIEKLVTNKKNLIIKDNQYTNNIALAPYISDSELTIEQAIEQLTPTSAGVDLDTVPQPFYAISPLSDQPNSNQKPNFSNSTTAKQDKSGLFSRIFYGLVYAATFSVLGLFLDFSTLMLSSIMDTGVGSIVWLFTPVLLCIGFVVGLFSDRNTGVNEIIIPGEKSASLSSGILRAIFYAVTLCFMAWIVLVVLT